MFRLFHNATVHAMNPATGWTPQAQWHSHDMPHPDAILSIQRGIDLYYVPLDGGSGSVVEVAKGALGAYLRTNWDGTGRNNLVDLPDC